MKHSISKATKKDLQSWITAIKRELHEIENSFFCFNSFIEIYNQNDSNFRSHIFSRWIFINFANSVTIQLARLLEKESRKKYIEESLSLFHLLEDFKDHPDFEHLDIENEKKHLEELFERIEIFRNKEIAHFTTEKEPMTYSELQNIFDELKDTFIRYTSFETYHSYGIYTYGNDFGTFFLSKTGNKFKDIFKTAWLKD